ncbi:hypothetical protein AK812_SmicGene45349, partial [Symbiodinium microadriaticum]
MAAPKMAAKMGLKGGAKEEVLHSAALWLACRVEESGPNASASAAMAAPKMAAKMGLKGGAKEEERPPIDFDKVDGEK